MTTFSRSFADGPSTNSPAAATPAAPAPDRPKEPSDAASRSGLRIATLGPGGTNHELVAHRYLSRLGIGGYEVVLVAAFDEAVAGLRAGAVDFVLQCAVHPATPATLGENFRDIFAIDSFISDSRELAVLTRREVAVPESIGVLLPANEKYVDLSRWKTRISLPSLPIIFERLLAGDIDSGLVYRDYADQYPDQVRVDEEIGSPDDVWIVYGRERVAGSGPVIWQDSPGARQIQERAARLQAQQSRVMTVGEARR